MENFELNADGTVKISDEQAARLEEITAEAQAAVLELLDKSGLRAGDIFVVGCSTSEVLGGTIGKMSIRPAAKAIFDGIYPVLRKRGIYIAAQCCEHLNRALIVEAECAEKYGLDAVCVRPVPKAGGSFAAVTYDELNAPVAVEHIKAHAGIDVGGTLIGMHLREVAVPVRLSRSKIGCASILCARTRPKFIGGARAVYE